MAEHRGFCFGVERAVAMAEKCAVENVKAATLGPIIHNSQMIEHLRQQGIGQVNALAELDGGTAIIRSHGVGPTVYEEAAARNIEIVDATCPHVRKAQMSARDLLAQGYDVVVVGERNHPEVKSIVAWADDKATVVETATEAAALPAAERIGVVVQTTFSGERFAEIVAVLEAKAPDFKLLRTICRATDLRQQAAVDIARDVDIMIVIGGRESANTARLAELCRNAGAIVFHIETAAELKREWFIGVAKAGVTAGASTPDWIIEEVCDKMQEFDKELEQAAQQKDKPAGEGAQTAGDAKPAINPPAVNGMIDTMDWVEDAFLKMREYETEFDAGSAVLENGSVITGRVVGVRQDEVFVDIGYKAEGIIPLAELACPLVADAAEVVREGDIIDVYVVDAETTEGAVKLSKVKADNIVAWDKLTAAMQEKKAVEGKFLEAVKGGLRVAVMGIRGFVPASQLDLKFVENLSEYVGQQADLVPIEVDRDKNRVVLSRRLLLEEDRRRKEMEVYDRIKPGQTVKGTVRRLADFGVFVDLGGVDGLIHLSDLAWHRVKTPAEIVNVDDPVEVQVLKVDPQARRISLSLKAVQRDPWFDSVDELAEGQTVKGKVVKNAKFGSFVEIAKGVEGLVHLSELDERRVNSADEVVSVGQEVAVKILSIDKKEKRIALSVVQARNEAERAEYSSFIKADNKGLGFTIGDKLGHLFKRED